MGALVPQANLPVNSPAIPQGSPTVEIKINYPKQISVDQKPDIQQFLLWREEAMVTSASWREESWRDWEMYDGKQWTDEDRAKAEDAGLSNILTLNRVFPTLNLILGSQIVNKYDVIAKARTVKDGEINQVMTEGIKFVMDQWDGEFKVSAAFRDECIPGIGWMTTGYSNDPRREKVKVAYKDWKEVWWDPYSSPWVDIETTRYMLSQRWMDVGDLIAVFPSFKQDILDAVDQLSDTPKYSSIWDEASQVEEKIKYSLGTGWTVPTRQRIRPCEMWYTLYETCLFAQLRDGTIQELSPSLPPLDQFDMIRNAQQIITANVKKIHKATFLGNLLLDDSPSPYSHDQYPFIPFIGYLDRFGSPYGVPRQIRDMQEEINKRRSMALALLNSRRVIMEEDAPGKEQNLQDIYDEANKMDGVMVVSPGAIGKQKILIVDQAKFTPQHLELMNQSEAEIQAVTGANAERMGYKSNAVSDVAMSNRQQSGSTVTVSLTDNLRRSLSLLGNQTACLIQGSWNPGKVLRVTDRLSGAEKYMEVCKRVSNSDGTITIKNNITQCKFDMVVSQQPISDTIREANMNMMIEWVKKSPPNIIPQLIVIAMEMSNMPDKDQILEKLKPMLGLNPIEEDMTEEQRKQDLMKQLQEKSKKEQQALEMQMKEAMLELENKGLLNEKVKAEIQKILTECQGTQDKNAIAQDKNEVNRERIHMDGVKTGFDMSSKQTSQDMEKVKLAHGINMDQKKHGLEVTKTAIDATDKAINHETAIAQQNFDNRLSLTDNLAKIKAISGPNSLSNQAVIGGKSPSV